MDKLKEYLLRHKAELDVDSPASDTWDYIGSKMPARSGFSKWVVRYTVAACVIALAGTGLWLVIKNNKVSSDSAKHNSRIIKREPLPGKERIENSNRKEEGTLGKDIV